MKILFMALCLTWSFASSAKELNSMKCTLQSNYLNFKNEIVIDLNNPDFLGNGPSENGKLWEIAWSLTECEDNTSISFDHQEYKKFISGDAAKHLNGRLTHSEPSIVLEADLECVAN